MKLVPVQRSARRPIESIREDVDRLLNFPFTRVPMMWEREQSLPSIDMWDDDRNIYIETDMPGIDAKDISVTVKEDTLTIAAKREETKEENKKDYYYSERYQGSFSRAIDLPRSVDAGRVNAEYQNGVLKITLPKKEDVNAKEVKINVR